jgi:cytochrome c556
MMAGGARLRNILLPALLAVAAAGCVIGPQRMIGTGDLVFDRQRLGRVQEAQLDEMRRKLKAGDIQGIAVNAEVIAITAMQIPSLFPEGSLTDKSRAKPEIWQRWSEFEAAAKNTAIWSERLRDVAVARDERLVADIMKDYSRIACGSCHDAFRVPPPRS